MHMKKVMIFALLAVCGGTVRASDAKQVFAVRIADPVESQIAQRAVSLCEAADDTAGAILVMDGGTAQSLVLTEKMRPLHDKLKGHAAAFGEKPVGMHLWGTWVLKRLFDQSERFLSAFDRHGDTNAHCLEEIHPSPLGLAYQDLCYLCAAGRLSPSLRESVPELGEDDKSKARAARALIEHVVAAHMAPGVYTVATEPVRP